MLMEDMKRKLENWKLLLFTAGAKEFECNHGSECHCVFIIVSYSRMQWATHTHTHTNTFTTQPHIFLSRNHSTIASFTKHRVSCIVSMRLRFSCAYLDGGYDGKTQNNNQAQKPSSKKRMHRTNTLASTQMCMHGRFVICWFVPSTPYFFHWCHDSSVVTTWFLSHSYKLHFHFICAYDDLSVGLSFFLPNSRSFTDLHLFKEFFCLILEKWKKHTHIILRMRTFRKKYKHMQCRYTERIHTHTHTHGGKGERALNDFIPYP